MLRAKTSALVAALCLAAAAPAMAEDILVTQYKADPSGAPYGVALEKGILQKGRASISPASSPAPAAAVRCATRMATSISATATSRRAA